MSPKNAILILIIMAAVSFSALFYLVKMRKPAIELEYEQTIERDNIREIKKHIGGKVDKELSEEEKIKRDQTILEKYNFLNENDKIEKTENIEEVQETKNKNNDDFININTKEPEESIDREKVERDQAILEKYDFLNEDEETNDKDSKDLTDEEKAERDRVILEKYGF